MYPLIPLTHRLNQQGCQAVNNHPVFLDIINSHFYGEKGIGRMFPDDFYPLFPLPAMAYTRTMVCVFSLSRVTILIYSSDPDSTE